MPAALPTVHHTEHHGIPIAWANLEGPLTGTLVFGVGLRDERPEIVGITHLTEHLLMRTLGPDVIPIHDAVTSDSNVQFSVTGLPADVANLLNDLGKRITAPSSSEADLLLERRVIEAEHPPAFAPGAGLLTFRYGLGSIGNAHAGAPTLASITLDEVRDWITTWMVTGNAHLVFTGPVPENLDLHLPNGDAPDHGSNTPLLGKPTLVECDKTGVALSLLVEESISRFFRDALAFELESELRHRRGLIYSVDTEVTIVEPGLDQVDFVLDPRDDDIPEVIERCVTTLRRLSEEGFGDTATEVSRSFCLSAMADPYAWRSHLEDLAVTALVGGVERSVGEYVEQANKLSADALTKALNAALGTLLVAYDEDVELSDDLAKKHALDVDSFSYLEFDAPSGPTSEGRSWRGRGDLSFGCRAKLNGDTLWLRLFGEWGHVRLGEVAVVGEHSDGFLTLIDLRGRLFMFDPGDWWRAGSLREAILDKVPVHVRRDFSWHDDESLLDV